MAANGVRVASIVVGTGFVKAFGENDMSALFPSITAHVGSGVEFNGFSADDEQSNDFVIDYDKTKLAIGTSAWRKGTVLMTQMDRTRIGSPFYRNLFAAALTQVVPPGRHYVHVVLTLPLEWYVKREEVKASLSGYYEITCRGQQYCLQVDHDGLRIVPEGFGIVAGQMLDAVGNIIQTGEYADDGSELNINTARVGVIEIGTRTIDLSFFDRLQYVQSKSLGLEVGLSSVWTQVQRWISRQYGRSLSLHEIDTAIRLGVFRHNGEAISITTYTQPLIAELGSYAYSEASRLWDGGSFADVIFTGGGGGPQVWSANPPPYPHAQLVNNAHTADAYGAFLYGLFRERNA